MWVPVLAAALDTGGAEGRAVLVRQREQPGPLAGPGKQSQGELLIITVRTWFELLASNPNNLWHQISLCEYGTCRFPNCIKSDSSSISYVCRDCWTYYFFQRRLQMSPEITQTRIQAIIISERLWDGISVHSRVLMPLWSERCEFLIVKSETTVTPSCDRKGKLWYIQIPITNFMTF